MCGLVGVASKNTISVNEQKAFELLLYVDTVRGKDSTGVAAVRDFKTKKVQILKRAVPGPYFLANPSWRSFVRPASRLLLGHNRASTKGKTNDANAHPFRHKHITLAHNGTLTEHHKLPGDETFEVDSEAVAYAMATHDDTVELLEQLDGAFALTWYDQRKNTLNFARNEKRPLAFAVTDNSTLIYWASEIDMLRWVLTRCFPNKKIEYFALNSGNWLEFDLNKVNFSNHEGTVFKPLKKDTIHASYPYSKNCTPKYHWDDGYYKKHTHFKQEKKQLKALGYEVGNKVYLEITDYKTFQGGYGTVTAVSIEEGDQGPIFTAYGIRPELGNAEFVSALVKGMASNGKDGKPTIQVQSLTTFDLDEVYPSEVIGESDYIEDEDVIDRTTDNVLALPNMVKGPANMYIPRKEFYDLTDSGCINCGATLYVNHAEDIIWVNEGRDPLCPDCSKELNELTKVNN